MAVDEADVLNSTCIADLGWVEGNPKGTPPSRFVKAVNHEGIHPKKLTITASFDAASRGVFPAAELIHDKLTARCDVKRLGPCDGGETHFFTTGTDKKGLHPLVQRLVPVRR